jgi:hypothetical protein
MCILALPVGAHACPVGEYKYPARYQYATGSFKKTMDEMVARQLKEREQKIKNCEIKKSLAEHGCASKGLPKKPEQGHSKYDFFSITKNKKVSLANASGKDKDSQEYEEKELLFNRDLQIWRHNYFSFMGETYATRDASNVPGKTCYELFKMLQEEMD